MKLQRLFNEVDSDDDPYFLSFAPITTSFSNFDFNFLNPNTASADEARQNEENKMAFAFYCNAVVRDPKIFKLNSDETLESAYGKILNNAILIDSSISEDEKAAYLKARAVLFVDDDFHPTPAYTKYQETAAKLAQVVKDLSAVNDTLNQAGGNDAELLQQKQQLEARKSIITNDWAVSGSKDVIENALKVVSALNEKGVFKSNFLAEIVSNKAEMDKATTVNSDMRYLPAFCLPQNLYQYGYTGWKKISLTPEEVPVLESEAKAYLGEELYNAYSSSETGAITKIEFEYLFVSIQRNWFKQQLVNSPFWKFREGDTTIVSDGQNVSAGILPAFIDKLIFVRRIMQYVTAPTDKPAPAVNNPAPATYQFAEIAKLRNFAALNTIKPRQTLLSKFRMAPGGGGASRPMVLQHMKVATGALTSARTRTIRPGAVASSAAAGRRVMILTHFPVHAVEPGSAPAVFTISFVFTDGSNNPVGGLDLDVIKNADGTEYSAITDNTGKISFENMTAGAYHLKVSDNEIYEDFENTYNFSAATSTSIVLQKRPNPKFNMWLFGAVNYQLPKLPRPLENFTYS